MEKQEMEALLKQLKGLLIANAQQIENVLASGAPDMSSLYKLWQRQRQCDTLIRSLLDVYVRGDAILTELLDTRYFEIELAGLLAEQRIH